jgi:hypothetical protein
MEDAGMKNGRDDGEILSVWRSNRWNMEVYAGYAPRSIWTADQKVGSSSAIGRSCRIAK